MKARGLAWLLVLGGLGGCSCGDDDDDVGTGLAELAAIGSAGGAFELGGLRGVVPAGAVDEGDTIVVRGELAADVAGPPGAVGPVYELEADRPLREPITLELPYVLADLAGRSPLGLRVASSPDGVVWDCDPMTAPRAQSSSVLAVVSHLSFWTLRYNACEGAGDCTLPERCFDPGPSGYCAMPCTGDGDCPDPTLCFCGICSRDSCDAADDPCSGATTCSVEDGRGVCLTACAPLDRCGDPADQQLCSPGGRCAFQQSALCPDLYACADGEACLHQWCVPDDSGCECGVGECACETPPDECPDAPREDCAAPGDEDDDGLADCADPDCVGSPDCTAANAAIAQVAVGVSQTTCVRTVAGHVKCWGQNDLGQLGLGDTENRGDAPGEMGDALPAVDLGTGRTAIDVCTGDTACAVLDDGSVKCWGNADNGQLGQGDTENRGDAPGELGDALPAIDLGGPALRVTCGSWHVCALLDDGSVKCWGDNQFGNLGLGDTDDRGDAPGEMGAVLDAVDLGTGRTAVALSTLHDFTCAILDDGALKCWGENLAGQLGLGDRAARGAAPGQMGDALPAVDLGGGRRAAAVSTGSIETCALADDATVACWGQNAGGTLGIGSAGGSVGDGPGEMGDALPRVDLGAGRSVTAIAAGEGFACAIRDDDAVRCWGVAMGLGDREIYGDVPGEMGEALPAVDLGADGVPVALASSIGHVCALFADGRLKCWGNNGAGQLGLGDAETRGFAPAEMGDALPFVEIGGE